VDETKKQSHQSAPQKYFPGDAISKVKRRIFGSIIIGKLRGFSFIRRRKIFIPDILTGD